MYAIVHSLIRLLRPHLLRDNLPEDMFREAARGLPQRLDSIFQYLMPEYARAYRVTGYVTEAEMYEFDVPSEITAPLARTMYWDLMNKVRFKPIFPNFTVTQSLKNQF